MSNPNGTSSSSYSFSTTSYTSSSSSRTNGGQTSGSAYSQQSYSTPQGSGVRTTTQNLGERAVQETREWDAQGRPLVGDGSAAGGRIAASDAAAGHQQGRITDVTDEETEADKLYRERMEDEYAKREGGA